jgi:hypothetical protein
MLSTINKVIGHEKVSGTTIIHCIHGDIIHVFVNTKLCAIEFSTFLFVHSIKPKPSIHG